MRVTFLGSGDAFSSGSRFQTCIHVHTGGPDGATNLLLDCGASSLVAMKHFGIETSTIDTILLSHLHGDHFGGIPFFILDAQYVSARKRPLLLAGPPGLEGRVREAMEVFYSGSWDAARKFSLEFVELEEQKDTQLGGELWVTAYEVVHPSGAPSYALRVDFGEKVLAFSGDTEWTEALIPASRGADLFICECYSFEKKIKNHLDYGTLMEHRKELGCGRLVLTHMGEEMLERISGLEVEGAEDGKRYVL